MNRTVSANSAPFPLMKFAVGLMLFLAGALYTLDSLEALGGVSLARLWPFMLIAFGILVEADAVRRGRFGCGLVMIGIGTWLLAGSYHLLGLTYETACPLGIVVIGFGLLVDSILDTRVSIRKESQHGPRV